MEKIMNDNDSKAFLKDMARLYPKFKDNFGAVSNLVVLLMEELQKEREGRKEGEKYKQICRDIESLMELDRSSLYRDQMKFIKQKYFPPAKKIMIVEIEGENEDLVKTAFNYLKAFLERNKDGFNCKYKIKEGD